MTLDNAERFERLLAALAQDLIAATDEEILEAASDLGMNPAMRGSAAFFGVTISLHSPFAREGSGESSAVPGGGRRSKDDPPG